jgi:hypothetical protein
MKAQWFNIKALTKAARCIGIYQKSGYYQEMQVFPERAHCNWCFLWTYIFFCITLCNFVVSFRSSHSFWDILLTASPERHLRGLV